MFKLNCCQDAFAPKPFFFFFMNSKISPQASGPFVANSQSTIQMIQLEGDADCKKWFLQSASPSSALQRSLFPFTSVHFPPPPIPARHVPFVHRHSRPITFLLQTLPGHFCTTFRLYRRSTTNHAFLGSFVSFHCAFQSWSAECQSHLIMVMIERMMR